MLCICAAHVCHVSCAAGNAALPAPPDVVKAPPCLPQALNVICQQALSPAPCMRGRRKALRHQQQQCSTSTQCDRHCNLPMHMMWLQKGLHTARGAVCIHAEPDTLSCTLGGIHATTHAGHNDGVRHATAAVCIHAEPDTLSCTLGGMHATTHAGDNDGV
jgi:hypothetical protein